MSGSTGIESLPTMMPSISEDWFFWEWEKDALGLEVCSPLEAHLNHSVFLTAYTEYLRYGSVTSIFRMRSLTLLLK